ncbi:MAG: hypothetical protein ACRC5A_03535 [Enterobacteriaceae bacterium]
MISPSFSFLYRLCTGYLTILFSVSALAGMPLLITSGTGGDANGARVIQQQLKARGETVAIRSLRSDDGSFQQLQKECASHGYGPVLFVGKGSIDALMAQTEQAETILQQCKVGLYTHLLSEKLIRFLNEVPGNTHFQLFALQSEVSRYQLQLTRKESITALPLAIQTVELQGRAIDPAVQDLIGVPAAAIWLGGTYTNAQGKRVEISNPQFYQTMLQVSQQLVQHHGKGKDIAIILSPRTLAKELTQDEVTARLQQIQQPFQAKYHVVFYVHASQWKYKEALIKEGIAVKEAPSYGELIRYFSELTKIPQYATVDQFNIFSDLHTVQLNPLLLNPQDSAQVYYAEYYQQLIKTKQLIKTHQLFDINAPLLNFLFPQQKFIPSKQ